VGKTSKPNPYDRWKQHLQLARSFDNLQENNSALSMPILRAICKHGADNFKFRVIEECRDDSVSERETYWIQQLGTYGNGGYNATLGGEGVKKAKKDWANHPQSKPVSCYTLESEWIRDYDSIGLAADALNNRTSRQSINACIKGKTFQAFGYRWSWKGEEPKVVENRVNRRGNVYGINPTLGRKKMWKSQADVAEEVNGNRKDNNSIFHSLRSSNNSKLQVKGWYFFKTKPTNWTPAKRGVSTENCRKGAAISAEKRMRPICGVNIKTGEIVEFDSMSKASFFIKGMIKHKKREDNQSSLINTYTTYFESIIHTLRCNFLV
jgi:hypothetical protein